MVTPLHLNEAEEYDGERRHWVRRPDIDQEPGKGFAMDMAKIVIPILLAWGVSYITASGAIQTEVAVIKATEQNHFEEIQRTLRRVDEYIARQESRGR